MRNILHGAMVLRICVCLALASLLPASSNGGDSSAAASPETSLHRAAATNDFLDSIGVVSTFPDRGQPLDRTVEMLKYGGFRWVRAGIEGVSEDGPTTVQTFVDLHRLAGVKINWGLVSGGSDLDKLLATGRVLADAGALLAFEGNNEPNNWQVSYDGETGGGPNSWMPVAKLQRDLYRRVKSDPVLAAYPVWSISEPGAQTDNVGLQFLTIPEGADTLMPAGTKYADYANVHNYIYHPHAPLPEDNKVWNAADPGPTSPVDGLYGNYGLTWAKWFTGYSPAELERLPRVTTETGVLINEHVSEDLQALHLLNLYLAQFKRGYSYTSVYLLRDRTDEAGNQAFGFFRPDYSHRRAALYLHNLTTILADEGTAQSGPGVLEYKVANQPETVHDLLLQRSDGTFQLVIWGERLEGADEVTIELGKEPKYVALFDPTVGTQPVKTLKGTRSIALTLTNHPVIVEIPGRTD